MAKKRKKRQQEPDRPLKFIRIFDFNLIPPSLVDQVKPKEYETERLFQLGPHLVSSPFTLLFVLADKDHVIQGFLWAMLNALDQNLYGQVLSVSREYQDLKGTLLKQAVNHLVSLKKQIPFRKLYWITTRSEAFEKHGFKKSDRIMMEVA